MTRLTNLTPAEKKVYRRRYSRCRTCGREKLNQPNRHIVLNRARAQIESQRYADRQHCVREDDGSSPILPGHVRAPPRR